MNVINMGMTMVPDLVVLQIYDNAKKQLLHRGIVRSLTDFDEGLTELIGFIYSEIDDSMAMDALSAIEYARDKLSDSMANSNGLVVFEEEYVTENISYLFSFHLRDK